jgi:hypothetical protein
MAAFEKLDWRRLDVGAIVNNEGLLAAKNQDADVCLNWLRNNGYEIVSVDCRSGLSHVIPFLGELFRWEENFGYQVTVEPRNLDALRDGFDFTIPESGGLVFELIRPDVLWVEDPRWLMGLLSIAREYSRWKLALGQRFFTFLVLPAETTLIGTQIDVCVVPQCLSERQIKSLIVHGNV